MQWEYDMARFCMDRHNRAILDLEGAFSFLDVAGVLRLLDDRPVVARELFRRHVEADRSKPPAPYKLARMDGV